MSICAEVFFSLSLPDFHDFHSDHHVCSPHVRIFVGAFHRYFPFDCLLLFSIHIYNLRRNQVSLYAHPYSGNFNLRPCICVMDHKWQNIYFATSERFVGR